MTSDDLADELVTHFNALADKPITYNAANPADTAQATNEASDWQVFVMPFEESEESIDRGDMCDERLRCSVVVNGPIRGTTTRKKGIELVRFLRLSLKETEFDRFKWARNETVSLFDPDEIKTNRFLSLFHPEYFNFA